MTTIAKKEEISRRDVRRAIKRIGIAGVLLQLEDYCRDMASGRDAADPIGKHYGQLADIIFDAKIEFKCKAERFDAVRKEGPRKYRLDDGSVVTVPENE